MNIGNFSTAVLLNPERLQPASSKNKSLFLCGMKRCVLGHARYFPPLLISYLAHFVPILVAASIFII